MREEIRKELKEMHRAIALVLTNLGEAEESAKQLRKKLLKTDNDIVEKLDRG